MERWPHQVTGLRDTVEAIDAGEKRICVTSPTGGGKTLTITDLIKLSRERHWPSVLYTNRRMLFSQTMEVLGREGIDYGVRAAGYDTALLRDIQIAMFQSEASAIKRKRRELHRAKIVFVDEAHVNSNGQCQRIIDQHVADGAVVVGFTATPINIGHVYKHLVVAGVTSELRACGALVACQTYGPDEPDTKHIKRQKSGEFSENSVRKCIMTSTIFARVYDWWKRLNPDARPAILFGPDVAGSLWFAEQFWNKHGVPSAHIDGELVWINGRQYNSTQDVRDELKQMAEAGEVKIVCNRFVMREGIDWPFLYHGIFATVFGALTSFLQSGGRLLRAHPTLDHVIVQDHGGNYWRHGSLNADREWDIDSDAYKLAMLREERFRNKKEAEPIVCPQCKAVRGGGPTCPRCGHESRTRSRMVVQHDGSLKRMNGDVFPKRITKLKPDTVALWRSMYFRAKNSGMTFSQARALFRREQGYYPPDTIPNMPMSDIDWGSKVADVAREAII